MYLIINKTNNAVSLHDLGVVLGPRQGVDLERMTSSEKISRSSDLKRAVSCGAIEYRTDKKNKTEPEPQVAIANSEKDQDIQKVMQDLKGDILNEVKSLLVNNTTGKNVEGNGSLTKDDIKSILLEVLGEKKGDLPQSAASSTSQEEKDNIEEPSIDMSVLSRINSRVMDKMAKNTNGSDVKVKEEIGKSSILNNISELENLIG